MIKHIVFFLLGAAAMYLASGFIILDWDVYNWSIAGRLVFITMFWFYVFSFIGFVHHYRGKK